MEEIVLPQSMEDAVTMGCCGLPISSFRGGRIRFVPDNEYEIIRQREEQVRKEATDTMGPDELSSFRVVGRFRAQLDYRGGQD